MWPRFSIIESVEGVRMCPRFSITESVEGVRMWPRFSITKRPIFYGPAPAQEGDFCPKFSVTK